jgi:hypothetical protein
MREPISAYWGIGALRERVEGMTASALVGDGLAQVVVVIGPVDQHGFGPEAFEQG